MRKPKPLVDEDGEVREITQADMKQAMRFSQLPKAVQEVLTSTGDAKALEDLIDPQP